MADPHALAANLETITGLPFVVQRGVVECEVEMSPEQYKLLARACEKARLLMRGKTAIEASTGRGVTFPEIPVTEIPDGAAAAIARIAGGEKARVGRLEEFKNLLEEKAGVTFDFDDGHKMLITRDPLTIGTRFRALDGEEFSDGATARASGKSYSPVHAPESAASMEAISGLMRAKAIDAEFISCTPPSSEIAVFDIDEQRLRAVEAAQDGLFERHLSTPRKVGRPGVPERSSSFNRGED